MEKSKKRRNSFKIYLSDDERNEIEWYAKRTGFNATQIPHAMRVAKEVLLWKKTTSFCIIKLAWQLTKIKKEVCLMKDTNSLSHTSYRCK